MSILFLLLKIIGVILAVILVFLLLCLFHPVFYQVEGILKEDAKPIVKGKFWWLFQILGFEILFSEGNLSLKIRIFGIGKELSGEKEKDGEDSKEEQKREETDKYTGDPVENKPEITNSRQEIGEPEEQKKSKFRHQKRRGKKQDTGERKKKSGVFSSIKRELSDETNKLAFSHVWREILYLLSHLKPKDAKG